MKFFIPHVKTRQYEDTYEQITKLLKEQLRMPIADRRIFSLCYTHDKKKWYAEVGQLEEQEGRYEILAIFESKPFIVFTRLENGDHGLTILVNKDEITDIVDFA
jgi:hypothetical protein